MTAGTRFVLHGVAVVDGRIRMFADTREGTGDNMGSRSLGSAMLPGQSWPNTRSGQRAAAAESLRLNIIERDRLAGVRS